MHSVFCSTRQSRRVGASEGAKERLHFCVPRLKTGMEAYEKVITREDIARTVTNFDHDCSSIY